MIQHAHHPALWLHESAELETLFDRAVKTRQEIHCWPLSVVERIEFADGRIIAYKAQLPPTVEPEFYQAARADLLPPCRMLGRANGCAHMAFEWIHQPVPSIESWPEERIVSWTKGI